MTAHEKGLPDNVRIAAPGGTLARARVLQVRGVTPGEKLPTVAAVLRDALALGLEQLERGGAVVGPPVVGS